MKTGPSTTQGSVKGHKDSREKLIHIENSSAMSRDDSGKNMKTSANSNVLKFQKQATKVMQMANSSHMMVKDHSKDDFHKGACDKKKQQKQEYLFLKHLDAIKKQGKSLMNKLNHNKEFFLKVCNFQDSRQNMGQARLNKFRFKDFI